MRRCIARWSKNTKDLEFIEKFLPNASPSTPEDILVIGERQEGRELHGVLAVEKSRCRHGFPRAFFQKPYARIFNSGMIRLSCPYLIKEIDELETQDKIIDKINSRMNGSDDVNKSDPLFENINIDHESKAFMDEINRDYFVMKKNLFDNAPPDVAEKMKAELSDEFIFHLMDSGFIGISRDRNNDIKCAHAHLADHFLRGNNKIGIIIEKLLEKKGGSASGCDKCWQQCDRSFVQDEKSWFYTSRRNGHKLHRKKGNFLIPKEESK